MDILFCDIKRDYEQNKRKDKWMGKNIIQRRIYKDTFKGGEFHLEMTENLSATSPFLMDLNDLIVGDRRDPQVQQEYDKEWEPLPV